MTLRIGINLTIFVLIFTSCDDEYQAPIGAFDSSKEIELTDYSKLGNWAAHPDKEDTADRIPGIFFKQSGKFAGRCILPPPNNTFRK